MTSITHTIARISRSFHAVFAATSALFTTTSAHALSAGRDGKDSVGYGYGIAMPCGTEPEARLPESKTSLTAVVLPQPFRQIAQISLNLVKSIKRNLETALLPRSPLSQPLFWQMTVAKPGERVELV